MTKFTEETTQCRYHLGPDRAGCRWVQLRHRPGSTEWQEPMPICPYCRTCLQGYFKYVSLRDLYAWRAGKEYRRRLS